jgi:indolepyruvate ferredoxin oxidoreductase
MGDSIYSNMMTFGAAWQMGLIPLSHAAIMAAIELNGAASRQQAGLRDGPLGASVNPRPPTGWCPAEVVEKPKRWRRRSPSAPTHLTAYQGKRLARRYRKLVDGVADPRLKEAVAKGYHKLLAYKDEYEVARLHLRHRGQGARAVRGRFED